MGIRDEKMLDNEQKLWYNLNKKLQGVSWFASQCSPERRENARFILSVCPVKRGHKMSKIPLENQVIAYKPIYAKITGSLTAGILLSQIEYWWQIMKEKPFYKIDSDFCDEIGCGFWELRAAKKKLTELGLIKTVKKGVPPKTFYVFQANTIGCVISKMWKNLSLKCGKTSVCNKEIPQYITETTPDITSENTINGHFENHKVPIEYINGADFPKSGKIPTRYISQSDFQSHPIIAEYMRLYQQRFSRSHPPLSGEHRQQVIDGIAIKTWAFATIQRLLSNTLILTSGAGATTIFCISPLVR